jgi:GxxExxY protein
MISETQEEQRDRLDQIATIIFNGALAVHRIMGPGMLERVYHQSLKHELTLRHLTVDTDVKIPLQYKGYELENYYVIDLLVEKQIIIEIKSIQDILPVHEAQIISYLRIADKRLGFLINFNVPLLKEGFKRFVNNF